MANEPSNRPPLNLEPIKARVKAVGYQFADEPPTPEDVAALIAEVERLRYMLIAHEVKKMQRER